MSLLDSVVLIDVLNVLFQNLVIILDLLIERRLDLLDDQTKWPLARGPDRRSLLAAHRIDRHQCPGDL